MTDAEQRFLAMCKMSPIGETIGMMARIAHAVRENDFVPVASSFSRTRDEPWFSRANDCFPIVASSFEALTVERPELRPYYDKAKATWEASQ